MSKFTFFFLLITILTSCMTLKPESARVSSPDYNDRQLISDPHYVKRPNIIAYTGTLATTIGGAYGMYKLGPVTQQNAEGTYRVDAANIALGALTGFALGTAIQYIAGKNKRIPIDNPKKWVQKANKTFTVYDYNNNSLKVIPTTNSNKYEVKDLADIKGYYRTFPEGTLKSELFENSLSVVKRSELPEVIALETNTGLLDKAKFTYFNRSESVDQLAEAANRFQGFNFSLEPKGIEITQSYSDAIKMLSLVSNLKNKKGLYISSLMTPYAASEAKDMLQKIGKDNFLLEERDLKNSTPKQQRHTLENIFYAVQPKDVEYGYKILSKYNFLKFTNKKEFAMSFFWDKIYDKYNDGTRIIKEFKGLHNKFDLKKVDISSNDLNRHLVVELDKEARSNIIVNKSGQISTQNENVERWKKSAFWDAPLIASTGELKYMLYGTVQNKSKFDLPLSIRGQGELYEKVTIDAWNLLKFTEKSAYLGSKQNTFIIPKLKSGDTQVYAILLDYGKQSQAVGMNVLGIQGVAELFLENSQIDVTYALDEFDSKLIKKQNLWLDIMKTGFEKASVSDPFNWSGNFEYLPDSYDRSYQEFMSSMAEAMKKKDYSHLPNCGCDIVSEEKEGFFFKDDYYTVRFENGYSQEYYVRKGYFEVSDGLIFNSTFKSYREMVVALKKECKNYHSCY